MQPPVCVCVCLSVFLADATHPLGIPSPAGAGPRQRSIHIVKARVFPVVMCGCESQTIKQAECRRIGAFKLWCWRRLWRVP